jgi:hypothetical protein
MLPSAPETLMLQYRWSGVEGAVQVEIGVNDDPATLGCEEFARGFPYCRATISPPAGGYADALGWIQLISWTHLGEGFRTDHFEPLGDASHPFCFFGYAPTLFDAPHSDLDLVVSDFVAHTFLCGLGGRLLEFRREARAVLGFSWGFTIRDRRLEISPSAVLGPADWDRHRDHLREAHPGWSFAPGFSEDPSGDP